MPTITCPKCQLTGTAPDGASEQAIRCKRCGTVFNPVPYEAGVFRKVVCWLLGSLAMLLSLIGLLMMLYYLTSYEITVPEYPQLGGPPPPCIYNTGLMHNRLVGTLSGIGLFLAGALIGIAAVHIVAGSRKGQ
jgi:hypothetical protein